VTLAAATGGCSVEGRDAGSSVPPLARLEERLAVAWPRSDASWFGSEDVGADGVVQGPSDAARARA
jgi:hypothetical protein